MKESPPDVVVGGATLLAIGLCYSMPLKLLAKLYGGPTHLLPAMFGGDLSLYVYHA